MLKTEPRKFTVADFRALAKGPPYYQLIHGDLIMSPTPNRYHQEILLNLVLILGNYLKAHPIGKIYPAPLDVFLTEDNAFEPDLLFVANENAHILTDYVEGAPDLVVEILSPSTSRFDREDKRKVYAQAGVKELWLVFPAEKKIDIFHLQQNRDAPAATYGKADVFASPLLPGLALATAEIFKQ